jgi:hypothetical protein
MNELNFFFRVHRKSISSIVFVHLLSLVPGLIVLAHLIAVFILKSVQDKTMIFGLASWVGLPAPPKLESMVEYGILLVAFFLTMVFFHLVRKSAHKHHLERPVWFWLLFLVYELFCIVLPISDFGYIHFWFVMAMLLPIAAVVELEIDRSVSNAWLKVFVVAMMGLGGALLFTGPWSPEVKLQNDYSDFAEYTRMSDGSVVENREFLFKRRFTGYGQINPCQALTTESTWGCLPLPRNVFSSSEVPFLLFPPSGGLIYEWETEVLFSNRPLYSSEKFKIASLWNLDDDDPRLGTFATRAKRDDFFLPYSPNIEKPYSLDNEKFIRMDALTQELLSKNEIEIRGQQHLGRFMYHHAFLYLPALERIQHKGDRVTPARYGEGLTRTLGWILSWSGSPQFNDYYLILHLALALYLVCLGIVGWMVTRELWGGLFSLVLGTIALLAVDFGALRMVPGFNPLRHFPDLICFLAVALSVKRHALAFSMLRALAIGVLIWWNREFGLFLLGGSLLWLFYGLVSGVRPNWVWYLRQMGVEVAVGLGVIASTGSSPGNDLLFYNLMGVGAPSVRMRDVFDWVLIWSLCIGFLVWVRFVRHQSTDHENSRILIDTAAVGGLYASFLSIYAIWNPSPNHKAVVLLCSVIPITTIVIWIANQRKHETGATGYLRYLTIVLVFIMFGFFFENQVKYKKFMQVFRDHVTFDWRFKGFHGISTAEPKIVNDSVALIDRYQPTGRLMIISRYDTLFQVLMNRNGMIPYVELPGSIITLGHLEEISQKILAMKPSFLFVDKDIFANREPEVMKHDEKSPNLSTSYRDIVSAYKKLSESKREGISELGEMFQLKISRSLEGAHRVGSLAALAELFRKLSPCYRAGESKGMLQVWHWSCRGDNP